MIFSGILVFLVCYFKIIPLTQPELILVLIGIVVEYIFGAKD